MHVAGQSSSSGSVEKWPGGGARTQRGSGGRDKLHTHKQRQLLMLLQLAPPGESKQTHARRIGDWRLSHTIQAVGCCRR